jgi:NTE family protein
MIPYLLLLLLILTSCGPNRLVPRGEPDPLTPFYVPEKIHIALVLGSGGVRGMAHVGVLEELEAAGIKVDLIVGCSAGSIVGALYADNPNVEAIKRAVWKLRTESMLDIELFNCRYGLSQGWHIRDILDYFLIAETFDQLQIPLVIVASDLNSGECVPIGSGDLCKAIQASCSIPFVFVPCKHMGRVLVDGGVINPVPVRVAKDLGAKIIIAVDLCEMLPKTFPTNLFEVATRSAEIAFMWQNEVCTRNADVIIRPKTCGVGAFNDRMKSAIYKAGKHAAHEKIPLIKKLIAEKCENNCSIDWKLVTLDTYSPGITHDP